MGDLLPVQKRSRTPGSTGPTDSDVITAVEGVIELARRHDCAELEFTVNGTFVRVKFHPQAECVPTATATKGGRPRSY